MDGKRRSQDAEKITPALAAMNQMNQGLRKQLTMPLSSQSEDKEPASTQFDEVESA